MARVKEDAFYPQFGMTTVNSTNAPTSSNQNSGEGGTRQGKTVSAHKHHSPGSSAYMYSLRPVGDADALPHRPEHSTATT